MSAQHTALCRITAEVEAAKPDREAMIAHVRKAIEDAPQISTAIGWLNGLDTTSPRRLEFIVVERANYERQLDLFGDAA